MEFRPCIDIHNGKVKQIIGASLSDKDDNARENFVAEHDAAYYADIYHRYGLRGGHVIMLNSRDSEFYDVSRKQVLSALGAHPGEMQAGGGITDINAADYIRAGASHVIVTSYVFKDGEIVYENLKKLADAIGKERIVLDLSCRRRGTDYYVVTDRWQKYTDMKLSFENLEMLSGYCDEFLIHAADVEGKTAGIERNVLNILGKYKGNAVTYAGGVHNCDDVDIIGTEGRGRVNVTVGSALKLFGGSMLIEEIVKTAAKYRPAGGQL